MVTKHQIMVLGGGLAGIALLKTLKNSFCLEKNNYLLGHAASFEFDGDFFDEGAHICHSKDPTWLARLNLENTNIMHCATVKNFDQGKWIGYPVQNHLSSIEFDVANTALMEIEALAKNKSHEPSNYQEWCEKTYGDTLTTKYYQRFTKKYWRTEMSDMNTDWLGGRLIPLVLENVRLGRVGGAKDQSVFSKYYYPRSGGFAALFKDLISGLDQDRYCLNTQILSIDTNSKHLQTNTEISYEYEKIYSTIPLNEFVKLDTAAPIHLKKMADQLKFTTLFTLVCHLEQIDIMEIPDWFYVYDEALDVSRIMNISRVSGQTDGPVALQFETYRRNDENYCLAEIEENMMNACETIFGVKPEKYRLKKTTYSYVVPTLKTPEIVREIFAYYEGKSVEFRGLYGRWNYIWSDKAYLDGTNV